MQIWKFNQACSDVNSTHTIRSKTPIVVVLPSGGEIPILDVRYNEETAAVEIVTGIPTHELPQGIRPSEGTQSAAPTVIPLGDVQFG